MRFFSEHSHWNILHVYIHTHMTLQRSELQQKRSCCSSLDEFQPLCYCSPLWYEIRITILINCSIYLCVSQMWATSELSYICYYCLAVRFRTGMATTSHHPDTGVGISEEWALGGRSRWMMMIVSYPHVSIPNPNSILHALLLSLTSKLVIVHSQEVFRNGVKWPFCRF